MSVRRCGALGGMAVSACAVSIACCGGCAQKQRAEAPEPVVFRAGDDRGRVLLPESFDGRIVVLAFLDGPAGGNRQAAPYIERLHDRFAADNRVLVVAVGDRTVLGLSARSGLTVMPEAGMCTQDGESFLWILRPFRRSLQVGCEPANNGFRNAAPECRTG